MVAQKSKAIKLNSIDVRLPRILYWRQSCMWTLSKFNLTDLDNFNLRHKSGECNRIEVAIIAIIEECLKKNLNRN